MIRDGILTSERVDQLGALEEVFYRRLMSVVDDYGRYYANPKLLRAACFPLKLEKISDSDIGKWLQVTEKAGLVRQYLATDGKRYIELIDFGQRIQAKSKFPAFDSEAPESTVIHGEPPEYTGENRLGVVEGVVEGVGVKPARKREQKPKSKTLPDGFGISTAVREWATAKGYTHLDAHLESFIGKAKAKNYTYVDWDQALMNAIRDDWAKLTGNNGGSPQTPVKRRKQLGEGSSTNYGPADPAVLYGNQP
jgi:hypothetical protein